MPKVIWYRLAVLKKAFYKRDYSEVPSSRSRKFEPIYFIIRREPPGAGLFSNLNHVLQGLIEAEERELIPVVDMQNYWTSYSLSVPVNGTRNTWEYFFYQPTIHSLNEAYASKRYVLSKGNRIAGDHWLTEKNLAFALDPEKVLEMNRTLTKYVKLNPFALAALEYVKDSLAWKPEENLGVSLRGTHYLQIEPHGHPKQPDLETVFAEIEKAQEAARHKKIFLACEDSDIRKAVESHFPGLILRNFRDMKFFKDFVSNELNLSKRNLEVMSMSLGYLIEIILLSECKSCVTSLANGSVIGIALNQDGFEYKKIMENGVY